MKPYFLLGFVLFNIGFLGFVSDASRAVLLLLGTLAGLSFGKALSIAERLDEEERAQATSQGGEGERGTG